MSNISESLANSDEREVQTTTMSKERRRLRESEHRLKNWSRWGPFLSERQWGTVREDYSNDGSCWNYFPYDHSISRAYRWGEDGLLGITDRQCRLCFGFAFWNLSDSHLKERLFGLTGPEGNHGEDVKECYYYLDSTPTYSYFSSLYRYPQSAFPYEQLRLENRKRSKLDNEFELTDTTAFNENRFFDILVEYAKESPEDILIRLTVTNRGPDSSSLFVIPQLWFRNTWSWGRAGEGYLKEPPSITKGHLTGLFVATHPTLGTRYFYDRINSNVDESGNSFGEELFTDNITNMERLFQYDSPSPYVKDSFHRYVVEGKRESVNPELQGTKLGIVHQLNVPSVSSFELKFRLKNSCELEPKKLFDTSFTDTFSQRIKEADEFYDEILPAKLSLDDRRIMRQSYAGLLHSKQFYYFSVKEWLEGDPTQPAPSPERKKVRNTQWRHLYNRDLISMPDKWEYPWYAAWDLAFHMIPFARIDPNFAKRQLILFLREWYLHPNGQIPAYEFAFSDVNPPVHAWACWRVYKMTSPQGKRDKTFLSRVFHKLLVNFTWWVNQKDLLGNNLFSGGFLGLDNIGVFDRSAPLPTGGHLEQADATAWMAFYCGTMLSMALELAREDPAYGDVASKFFEHFVGITDAINHFSGTGLWDQLDGFYYDQLNVEGRGTPLRIRSLVGLLPLIAVEVLDHSVIKRLSGFRQRMEWFLSHHSELRQHVSFTKNEFFPDGISLLSIPSRERLERMLRYLFDEHEFFSPYGIRSLSKIHSKYPYIFQFKDSQYSVQYTPGESNTTMFGGNSNWRGPVWFPINYLIIEALERYHYFYRDSFMIEVPLGSGNFINLLQASKMLASRLTNLFKISDAGYRPFQGNNERYNSDPLWKDNILFHEYFHGDTGKGLGASHQTGWTALVNRCFEKLVKDNL